MGGTGRTRNYSSSESEPDSKRRRTDRGRSGGRSDSSHDIARNDNARNSRNDTAAQRNNSARSANNARKDSRAAPSGRNDNASRRNDSPDSPRRTASTGRGVNNGSRNNTSDGGRNTNSAADFPLWSVPQILGSSRDNNSPDERLLLIRQGDLQSLMEKAGMSSSSIGALLKSSTTGNSGSANTGDGRERGFGGSDDRGTNRGNNDRRNTDNNRVARRGDSRARNARRSRSRGTDRRNDRRSNDRNDRRNVPDASEDSKFEVSCLQIVNRLNEIYNEKIPVNMPTQQKDPAVASKLKNFMEHLGEDISVKTLEGNAVLPNPQMFKARYTCVFQESGEKLALTVKRRIMFEEPGTGGYTLCLDFEFHEHLVSAKRNTPPDGRLGVTNPRDQHLIVLYVARREKIQQMYLRIDKNQVGADKNLSEKEVKKDREVEACLRFIEDKYPRAYSNTHYNDYHDVPVIG